MPNELSLKCDSGHKMVHYKAGFKREVNNSISKNVVAVCANCKIEIASSKSAEVG